MGSVLLLLGAGWLGGACGPVVATPVPEPPVAFDLSHVGDSGFSAVLQPPGTPPVHDIAGAAGSVPALAIVRITNLDTNLPVAAVTAKQDGSFDGAVTVSDGQELRFEWVSGDQRSAPSDAIYTEQHPPTPVGFVLAPSPRFGCLQVDPRMALDFDADGSQELTLTNKCAGAITIDNPRTRLSLPDFSANTALRLSIQPGTSGAISVDFARKDTGFREDVLLVDVNDGTRTLRYPFTLRAK